MNTEPSPVQQSAPYRFRKNANYSLPDEASAALRPLSREEVDALVNENPKVWGPYKGWGW